MTRVVVGEFIKGEKNPKIIGIGEAKTEGVRRGYITKTDLAVNSVKKAVAMAEETSGIKIKRAFVAIGGISMRGDMSSGSVVISKADGEVTDLDINKALEDSENNLSVSNKKVIHVFPVSYRLDGKEIFGRLEGMRGNKLEVKALFVTYSIPHLEDLLEVIDKAGVETIDVIASPLAGSHLALSEKQKIVGGAIVDIGSETVSLTVFENGTLVSLYTFSIGGEDITNDIALGLKIPLERAEEFKKGNISGDYSKKKLEEIIDARLSDIFELIENHLKKIKRSELLPAGIVFVGGGANTVNLEESSKAVLKLPSKVGVAEIFNNMKTKLREPSWFNVLGLVLMSKDNENYSNSSLTSLLKNLKNTVKSSIKQLMP
jgi:cell division protein FtsA